MDWYLFAILLNLSTPLAPVGYTLYHPAYATEADCKAAGDAKVRQLNGVLATPAPPQPPRQYVFACVQIGRSIQ